MGSPLKRARGDDDIVLAPAPPSGDYVAIGDGVFARTRANPLTGLPMLSDPNGFAGVVRKALTLLGVPWLESRAVYDYNSGRSTQIPAKAVFRVLGNPPPLTHRSSRAVYLEIGDLTEAEAMLLNGQTTSK